ncbi:MAG: DNA replication/repair protein RecF [Thiomicrorhabdus chilensis]|uniref:DNA replication/repair protein RecF n=1 Tax=Thiomicrorhabdus chilensis TaxID=63656 RepID=UPI00299D8BCB|nr:DNA replication/repair protein RecF [Thiomicrorhabdus chilensis]MDX1348023.1 DNA replication/repair protein RecF [Thiomicrorhabdus chilensis]
MTQIRQFNLQNFRNCSQAQCRLSSGLNLFVGDNAAGKTSLIEAIWLLATGRSFRTSKTQHLIQHHQNESTLFCEVVSSHEALKSHRLGMQKSATQTTLRIDGETVKGQIHIAELLPVQLLTPESHRLLEEGPKARRQFMDWGCFYQSQEFIQLWRQHQRILKQRNHALKRRLPREQIQLWDAQLVEIALKIDAIRQAYLEALTPYLLTFCQALMPEIEEEVVCQYRSGWPKNTPNLLDLMTQNFAKDVQFGHTQYGAHRADIRFKFGGLEAINTLSRGQQKLFVCALLLAQASLHEKVVNEPVIMLIDDLPAELDETHRLKLLDLLQILNIQHLITSTSESLIPILAPETTQIWHITAGNPILQKPETSN